jgi:DNA-binding CsgD family transcriptional regulator
VSVTVEPWLADQLPVLLGLATTLTGDAKQAEGLVAETVLKAGRQSRLRRVDFPEQHLRTLLVQTYLGGRGLDSTPPVLGATNSDRLQQLSRRERTTLVLRYDQDLTQAEIAAIMDRSTGSVTADLEHAHSILGVAPHGLTSDRAVRDLLRPSATAQPAVAAVVGQLDQRSNGIGRRRRRVLGLVIAAVAVALVVALVPLVVVPRLPAETRRADEWSLIHQVDPPEGWVVTSRTVTATVETTTVANADGESTSLCSIRVYLPDELDVVALPSSRSPASVRGRDGFFTEGDGVNYQPLLAWEYASNAWTVVECPQARQVNRERLVALADSVRFRPSEIALPFALSAVPEGYRIESATEGVAKPGGEVMLAKIDLEPGDANLSLTFTPDDGSISFDADREIQINGRTAMLDPAPKEPRLCIKVRDQPPDQTWTPFLMCVSGYWPLGDWPARAPLPVGIGPILTRTAEALRFADDLDDRNTWITGSVALP